ncbi:hypothetical protein [Endozoicomonas sp. ALD040]|uniref:hypothetical protein n=1 Tax=Endozoicomonas sp. ALD040 TaxID=3403079 RepID=UPI003BAF1CBC
MSNPIHNPARALTESQFLGREGGRITREKPGKNPGQAVEYAWRRCRASKGNLSMVLAGKTVSTLPARPEHSRFVNGGKSLGDRTVGLEPSASWFGSFLPTCSLQPAQASDAETQAELKKMDERIHEYYQLICQLHSDYCEVLKAAQQTEDALGNDIPFYETVLESQRKDQQSLQLMANELLDEFETLKDSFLADIQQRDQRHLQAYDQDPSKANFAQALIAHVRSLEDELRQKTLLLTNKDEEAHDLDRKNQELTRQAEFSEKQMIQALTEQDRMGRVKEAAGTLETNLHEASRRLKIFQNAIDKLHKEKNAESTRADNLKFQLNQVTAQLRERTRKEGQQSETELENIRLRRQLDNAQSSLKSVSEPLENFAALQLRSEQLETLTKNQTQDLQRIRGERDQAHSRVVAIEEQLKSHHAEMKQVMDETKKAEKGLNQLQSQIQRLQAQLVEAREHNEKLQADKLSSDTEVRQLRTRFASQVSDARIKASQANIQLNMELKEKKKQLEKERAHYHELSAQLEFLNGAMKKENEKASGYFEKSQRLEEKFRLGKERLTELESQKTQLKKQLKDTQIQLKGSNGRVSALEVQLGQQNRELEQLRATGDELKANKETLAQVQTDLRQTRSLLLKASTAETSVKEALQKKEHEVRTWIAQSREWNTARAALEGEVTTLKAGLQTVLKEQRRAEAEFTQQAKSLEDLAKSLLASETKLKLASREAQSARSSQTQQIESLTVEVSELRRLKEKAEDALLTFETRFKEDYSQSERSVSELNQQLIALKAQLSNVSEAEQRAIGEVAQAKSDCKKFRSDAVRLEQQVDRLTREVYRLRDEQKKAKIELGKERLELRSEVATLREKASKADIIEQELQLKQKAFSDQKAQFSQTESARKAQLERLRQDLDESNQKLHEEEAAKLGFQLDYNSAKSHLEQLQQEHAEAMAEIDRLKVLLENSGQAARTGTGFDFRESGVEFDDQGAYVSLSTATHQPNSLLQPLSMDGETRLTDLQAQGPRGVSRFEYQDLMRKKNELEQQMSDLKEELKMAQDQKREHKKRVSEAAREVADIKKQLTEVKAESEQFAHIASDRAEEEKKWREEVGKLTRAKAQIELEKQTQVDESLEFADKTVLRNAELETEAGYLRTRLEDLEYRLEKEMPTVMQENENLTLQNEAFKTALLDVVGLFREKLSEADQQQLEDKLLKIQSLLLPPQQ